MTAEQSMEAGGVDLKAARENAGLTLKNMFERTRISVVNLEAIENGDFHLLPVPIYTRNFIKTYAEALNIDGALILKSYEDYLHSLRIREKEAIQKDAKEKETILSRVAPYRSYLWVAGFVITFAAIALFVSIYYNPEPDLLQTGSQIASEAEESQTPSEEATPSQADDATDVQLPAPDAADAPVDPAASKAASPPEMTVNAAAGDDMSTLIITAVEETWIRIAADQQPPFEALLQPGEIISRKASKFQMDIGNAGGIKISFQGKMIENLGQSGQVIRLRLPSIQ
jgi:cytoskeletal protein RodZ